MNMNRNESQIELIDLDEKIKKKKNRLSNYSINIGNGKRIIFSKIKKKLLIRGILLSLLCFVFMGCTLIIGIYIKPSNIFMPISSTLLSLIITNMTRQIALPLFENMIWLELYYGAKLFSIDMIISNSIWSIQSLFIVLKYFRMKFISIVFMTFLIMILLSYLSPIWSLLLRLEISNIDNFTYLNFETCNSIKDLTFSLDEKNLLNKNNIIEGKLIDSFPQSSYGWGIANLNYSKINVNCVPEEIYTCQFGNKWGISSQNNSCNPNNNATDVLLYEQNNKIILSMLKNINYLNYDINSAPNTFVTSCSLQILTGITEANVSSTNILYSDNLNIYLDDYKTNLIISYISKINDDFFKKYILFGVSILENEPYNFIENTLISLIHNMNTCENTKEIINLKYTKQDINVTLKKNAVILSFICIFILHLCIIFLECLLLPKLGILRGRSIISAISCFDIELCKTLQQGHSAEEINEIQKKIDKKLKLYYGYIVNENNQKQIICIDRKIDKIENNKIYY